MLGIGDGKKVERCVLLSSSSSTFGGIWGAKEIWRLGICERSASVVGWLRDVGGEPRSLTAAGRNFGFESFVKGGGTYLSRCNGST